MSFLVIYLKVVTSPLFLPNLYTSLEKSPSFELSIVLYSFVLHFFVLYCMHVRHLARLAGTVFYVDAVTLSTSFTYRFPAQSIIDVWSLGSGRVVNA